MTDIILGKLGWLDGPEPELCGQCRYHDSALYRIGRGTQGTSLSADDSESNAQSWRNRSKAVINIGDTPSDLLSGRAAGVGLNLGVTNGTHTRDQLSDYASDKLLDSLRDLPALLSERNRYRTWYPDEIIKEGERVEKEEGEESAQILSLLLFSSPLFPPQIMAFYDLIVIGSGALGTFHAYHAARMGKKVLLLEKDSRPVSATVRNFGQVVPSGMAGKWFGYGRRSLEIYGDIQAEHDLTVRQNGSIYVASDEDEWTLANELYDRRRADGYPCELLSQAQTLARYPLLQPGYVRGALLFPTEVSVEPDQMIYRLIDYIVGRHGVTYRQNSAVVDCQSNHNGAIITLANRMQFRAQKVIICSGNEFRLLFPEVFAESGLVVSKLQMMQTVAMPQVALPGNILTGLTIRRYESFTECPSYHRIALPEHLTELKQWGIHILFKQALDGSIILGDSHEYAGSATVDDLGFDTKDYVNQLMLNEARRIVTFPLEQINRTWAGFYAQTADEIFEHDVDENIHVITGIGGKGMTSSAGYAEQKIGQLLGVNV